MKKLITAIAFLIAGTTLAYAQPEVVNAYNYHKYGELDKAMKEIDKAIADPDAAAKPKTWYYRALIYYGISTTKEEKYKSIATNPIEETIKACAKAMELDVKGNFKNEVATLMAQTVPLIARKGEQEYANKNYTKAEEYFEKAFMMNTLMTGKPDTLSLSNAALSAEMDKNYNKMIELNTKMIELKAGAAASYRLLSDAFKNKQDETNAVETIKKGRIAYPADGSLILAELQFYLDKGKDKEALDNLNLAISKDPKNEVLYAIAANIYDKLKDFAKAELHYKKALEIKPDYFDAAFNLGALYYNRGVVLTDEANALPLKEKEKFNKLNADADKAFKDALPTLENAHKIDPKSKDVMNTLKTLYQNLGMADKAKEIDAKLKMN